MKGTSHAKMGTIKDRNGMDLTEAEDKKRWQEYTELYKKDLHDPDNYDGVITHLEPDILECEVKWALESIITNKASGGDGIPVELFQILKDDAVKVLHSICQQMWKHQQWPQVWKRSVFIPIPKKGNLKEILQRWPKSSFGFSCYITWKNMNQILVNPIYFYTIHNIYNCIYIRNCVEYMRNIYMRKRKGKDVG